MHTREVGRSICLFLLTGFGGLVAASCGSANPSLGDQTEADASLMNDAQFFSASDGSVAAHCAPKTCKSQGYTCGENGDGCGGAIDCGSCTAPEFCGGGGYSACGTMAGKSGDGGAAPPCTPATCEELGFDCGWASDGCEGVVLCGAGQDGGPTTLASAVDSGANQSAAACPVPGYCGGGGPNKCGGNTSLAPDGAPIVPPCTPKSCADQGFNCGLATDGCANPLSSSCGTCTAPEYCGGAGPNKCGGSTGYGVDGGTVTPCVPKSCTTLGFDCGPQGDGCGNLISSCGTCQLPAYCGGGGPGVCGGSVYVAPDGGTVNLCHPTTCAAQNFSCGQADDGCGTLLQCGSCTSPQTCGGGGIPGKCGSTCVGDGGLCQYQQVCDSGSATTITGRVEAGISAFLNPNANANPQPFPPDPVPNVLVYVPNSPVSAFTPGASCRQCGADVSGSPLVSTYTNFDGTFTLSGVPTPPGSTIPLVIQLGRWRRQFTITTPVACTTSAVAPVGGTAGVLNLPRNHAEGNIPLTAVSTGNVDALECVLLKMGVDQAEFTSNTPPNGTTLGRVHVYSGSPASNGGSPGATVANANQETSLMANGGTYMNYDQILFPCWGGPAVKTNNELANLVTYADQGGHFFSTHYSYSWLVGNGEFNTVANWDLGPKGSEDEDNPGNGPWTLNVSVAPPVVAAPLHSGIFYKWLNYVCALSNSSGTCTPANPYNTNAPPGTPQVSIGNPRFDADSVANGSVDWIDGKDQTATENGKANPAYGLSLVEHFTFNTPVTATTQCGHAIYSDFHVSNVSNASGVTFPGECTTNEFSAQEKVLEYMLFDLASCVEPPASNCSPRTCAEQGLTCGPTSDGCGNALDCGSCPTGETCGGGGTAGVCGAPDGGACVPQTCAQQHLSCGPAGDGCGNLLTNGCGTCPTGQTCGGGGTPGTCGVPEGGSCAPQSCAAQHIDCGPAGDGCGNLIAGGCGTCPAGQTCGGGGTPGVCATPDGSACVPETCSQQHVSCGPAGDGCGNLIVGGCGNCTSDQTCGGGGTPGVCGGGACTPFTCARLGYDCGPAGDGCGGLLDCGQCQAPQTCGGAGVAGVCGSSNQAK
jgi:hypothetical protein